jgi:hypothetical protein
MIFYLPGNRLLPIFSINQSVVEPLLAVRKREWDGDYIAGSWLEGKRFLANIILKNKVPKGTILAPGDPEFGVSGSVPGFLPR